MQSEQLNELAGALAKAQGAMTNAIMNRINPHFKSKYADLASVLDASRKPLSENGLSVVQTMEIREGGMVLRTTLMHVSGQWIASEYPLPATARPQEMGSAQTYARRYSLAAIICNSADEDDDANAAVGQKQRFENRGRAVAGNGNAALPSHNTETGEVLENEIISPSQVENLQSYIVASGADIDRFCKYLKIPSIKQLPARDYKRALAALEAKAQQGVEAKP